MLYAILKVRLTGRAGITMGVNFKLGVGFAYVVVNGKLCLPKYAMKIVYQLNSEIAYHKLQID